MNIKLGYLGYISAGNATMLLFFLIGFGVVFASACMYVAYNRHRNPGWFFALGFFLGPIGLIIARLMKDKDDKDE